MKPMFSIIIPCYNQGSFLSQALTSIISQDFDSWECIVVDDGSQDNTNEVAVQWQNRDSRIKVFNKKNGGLSSARNFGLLKASGAYIQFLDCDDLLRAKKLSLAVDKHRQGSDVVVTDFEYLIGKHSEKSHHRLDITKLSLDEVIFGWDDTFSIPIHCGSFSRKIISDLRFEELVSAGEDWIFWIKVFERKPEVSYIDTPLVYYRLHFQSMTGDINHMINQKQKANVMVYKMLSEHSKLRFFERFSLEATTRREKLYESYRKKDRLLRRRIKRVFKNMFRPTIKIKG